MFVCVRVEGGKRDKRNGQALSLNITYGSAPCSSSKLTIVLSAIPIATTRAVIPPVIPRQDKPCFGTRDMRHFNLSRLSRMLSNSRRRSLTTFKLLYNDAYASTGNPSSSNHGDISLRLRTHRLKSEAVRTFSVFVEFSDSQRSHQVSKHDVQRASERVSSR